MAYIKRLFVTLIVTVFGAGFSPKAPGTAGSVMAVGLVYLVKDWSMASYSLLWCGIFMVGWWATLQWSRNINAKDSQVIVVDEVLGYMIAMAMLPRVASILWIQFILFRIFDAIKPPPIRQLDLWGKKFEVGPLQSLGVILDDLLAGLLSLIVFLLIKNWLILMNLIDSSVFS